MVALVSVPVFINVAGSSADAMKAALVTGYLLCAFTVPMALAAIPGGWLSERFGYRAVVISGLIVAIIGFWMMSLWKTEMAREAVAFIEHVGRGRSEWADVLGTGFMAAGLALAGIGIGLTIAPIGTAVINAVREQERVFRRRDPTIPRLRCRSPLPGDRPTRPVANRTIRRPAWSTRSGRCDLVARG